MSLMPFAPLGALAIRSLYSIFSSADAMERYTSTRLCDTVDNRTDRCVSTFRRIHAVLPDIFRVQPEQRRDPPTCAFPVLNSPMRADKIWIDLCLMRQSPP
jgi:hypothetical protein